MSNRLARFFPAVLLVVAGVPAAAQTPIYMPTTITASGTYKVTNDIVYGGGTIIAVNGTGVESVDIDLKGHTLTSTAGAPVITALNVMTLRITNGTIVDLSGTPADGISVDSSQTVDIFDVTVAGADNGIVIFQVPTFTVAESRILGASGDGIRVDGGALATPTQGGITTNEVINAGTAGIHVENNHANVVVSQNTVRGVSPGPGILIKTGNACNVDNNVVSGAALQGIAIDGMTYCGLTDNVVRSSGEGILLFNANDNTLEGNSALGNTGTGLRVRGSRNTLRKSTLNKNGDKGMHLEAGGTANFFQDNIARGNAGGGTACVGPVPACTGLAAPDYCDEATSTSSGGGNYMPGSPGGC